MSDVKKGNFFQRTKAAMSEVSAKAGKAIQNAVEDSLPVAERLADKIMDATKSAAETVSEKISDAIEAARPREAENLTILRLPATDIRLLLPNGYKRCRNSQSFMDAVKGRGNEELVYQKKTGSSENELVVRKIAPQVAMPVDDVPGVIRNTRQALADRQGIVEVKAGKRMDGCRYVYRIVKELSPVPSGGVTYHLRLNLFSAAHIVELDAHFKEIGMIGMRDNMCAMLADKAGLIEMGKDSFKAWSADPYDPDYTRGCLKNLSEREGLDALFPEHPLTQARELLLAVLENRFVKIKRDESEDADSPSSDSEQKDETELLRGLFTDQCRRITYAVDIDPKDAAKTAEKKPVVISRISTRSAIKIFYYLMAADGEVFHSEEEKFDAIGAELDPHFAEHKAHIVAECQAQLGKITEPEGYCDVLQRAMEAAIASSLQTEDAFITPKLLLWDMLTVAYSDESCDAAEQRLLNYVAERLNVDRAILLEMESSILTLMDLERELAWIKATDRPYLKIEALVNEIQDRKNVILESVKALLAL